MTMESLQELLERLESAVDFTEFSKARSLLEPRILNARDAGLLCQLAAVYRQWRLWNDAEVLLHQAMRIEPSLAAPHKALGLLLIHRDDLPWDKNLQRAKEALETAVRLETMSNDSSATTHTLLGRVYLSMGKRNQAESEFRIALNVDPGFTEAKYNLASSLDLLPEPPTAKIIDLLRECIIEDPHYFPALRDLGWKLRESNKIEAEYYLAKAMKEAHDDVLVHIYYARLKFDDDPTIAEKHYKSAIQLDPSDAELYRLLGHFYEHHNRSREANAALFQAIELDPANQTSIKAYLRFLEKVRTPLRGNLYAAAKKASLLPEAAIRELDEKVECLPS